MDGVVLFAKRFVKNHHPHQKSPMIEWHTILLNLLLHISSPFGVCVFSSEQRVCRGRVAQDAPGLFVPVFI